ncbi:MAG: glycosyltransferase family 2 protein [Eubacteriales bacterium]|nr:glycosyltransferase family 2 protein [Eubacteriales bacterium]
MARVTVIIPNYNGLRFLDPCMTALSEQSYRDFCVLIVDNGSTDGSVEKLHEYEDRGLARVIFLPENTGFSGAVNAGIEAADSELIVLLNNDTKADKDYLKAMVSVFDSDSNGNVGAVSPLMINMQDSSLIDSAGDGYSILGWAFQRGVGRNVELPKFSKRTPVYSACAGAAMYSKRALDEIKKADGWFDPMHFAYLEDVDVSWRLRINGYGIYFEPASRVLHVGSGTSGSKYNDFKVSLAARNNVYLNVKNMPLLMLLINLPFILLGVIIKQLFFIKRGFGGAFFKGFMEGIRNFGKAYKNRVRFRLSNLFNYIYLELFMIVDTFSYVGDFVGRKLFKK